MKNQRLKKIICMLIILSSSFCLFASYNWAGFSTGVEFGFNQTDLGVNKLTVGGSTFGVPLTFEGRNYFGSASKWGLGYAFGVYIPIASEQGDYGLSTLSTGIRPELTIRYHQAFNEIASAEIGFGYMFEYRSSSIKSGDVDYGRVTTMTHALTLDGEFGFNIDDVLTILIGGRIYTPVYIDKQIEKGPYKDNSGHYDQIGIYLIPQITISKTY